jgi:Eco57I restriction-modification methylase
MARVAITVEGGLIGSDLIEQIAATPQHVPGQRPTDFGLDSRLSEEIQKAFSDASIHWNAFNARLARGKESATTITRETWVLPLLEELGFTLAFQRAAAAAGGGTFMLSHRLGTDPAAPPVHIVSNEQELDRRGDAARSPHALVQDYLNRSDALWGIVTNGMTLRLLRNTVRFSKPSFIEFDLEAIFKGNLYSEFVLFFRLVHATRLPRGAGDAHECWLEKYYQQGIEQGGRVRERLRDGVQEALQILGTGLLAHPESGSLRDKFASGHIDKVEFYRQLLRLIYRLLFLMVAEERRLLFVRDSTIADRQDVYDRWYSIERLRRRADGRFFEDTHSDLWEGLKQTFRLFEDTSHASQLGLTALDGELFGRLACGDLIDSGGRPGPKLHNDRLLSAIWQLSTFEDSGGRRKHGVRRRVNFAGLDVEELGSVYESLLDYHPEVTIDGERSKFELVAGTERKSTGSYYTPPELVRELIKSALEPVIEERLAKAATRDEKERALLALKICDPASGSGHFLLAAARRLGRELARVRSGEAEPNPADYRRAIRDVIRRCIYAVDKNPLAVDLCKVALWIEGHEPGLPLSFLDHHVKCGDSLVGVFDLDVLRAGVPDDAYKPVTGDERAVASEIKKRNRADAKALFRHSIQDSIDRIAGAFAAISDLSETTPDEVQAKEAAYGRLLQGDEWERARWACDLWTAAFFAPLTTDGAAAVPTTRHVWEAAGGRSPQGRLAGLATELAGRQLFFHWAIEFPEVFASGGFDVLLGNPPWERIKLQEKEFFATRDREIADAPNKAARDRMIKALFAENAPPNKRVLGEGWEEAKHISECESQFVRESGRYPLTAFGDINTYAIFAETFLKGVRPAGRAGFIVPTGIATDSTTRTFFDSLISNMRLISLYSFENRESIFPGIDSRINFALVTLGSTSSESMFAFFLTQTEHISDMRRCFTLSEEDIALINPNTHTAPIFRSQADAELTKKFYKAMPVVENEREVKSVNSWGISFMRMFDMANDSDLFRTSKTLAAVGAQQNGNEWIDQDGPRYLLLYEAKMIHQFDHRWATYETDGQTWRNGTLFEKQNPAYGPLPRYWVAEEDVEARLREKRWKYGWLLGWRDICRATDERTLIATIFAKAACGDTLLLMFPDASTRTIVCLLAGLNCLCGDYVARQKVGGTHLKYVTFKQLT